MEKHIFEKQPLPNAWKYTLLKKRSKSATRSYKKGDIQDSVT